MSKMTVHAFSRLTGIKDLYVRAAVKFYPPEHKETVKLRQIVYPSEEIARSVQAYSKWLARKLQEQHRKRMEEIMEFSRLAAEVTEDG